MKSATLGENCHQLKDAADKLLICSRGKLFLSTGVSEFDTAPPLACKTTPKKRKRACITYCTVYPHQMFQACMLLSLWLRSKFKTCVEGPRIVLDLSNKLQGADSSQYRMTDLGFHYRPASDPENRCVSYNRHV